MVIGLTGGIGSGKTTIGRVISSLGYELYNSDIWGSYLMNHDATVIAAIQEGFGKECYSSKGLNRRYLADQVFGDKTKLSLLESIVHPALFAHFEEFVAARVNEIVFVESAILFESGLNRYCDKVVTISAPEELRISRVIRRDNSSYDAVVNRIKSQMSDESREQLSDYVVNCDEHNSVVKSILDVLAKITL